MRDCSKCPKRDYCIPDECEDLGIKMSLMMRQHQQAQIRKILFYVDYITERIFYGISISYLRYR